MKVILKAEKKTLCKDIPIEDFPFLVGRHEKPFSKWAYESAKLGKAISLLSRKHAIISEASGRFALKDLGSRNGTRLNDQKVGTASVVLQHGDRLSIAERFRFTVSIDSPSPPAVQSLNQSVALIPKDLQSGLSTVVIPRFPFHIGRTAGDFLPFAKSFPDHRAALSRSHAQLSTVDGQVFVEDLGSRNGTFLSESRIEQGKRHELQNGDQLSFGPFFAYTVEIYPQDVEETVFLGQPDAMDNTRIKSSFDSTQSVPESPPASGPLPVDGTLSSALPDQSTDAPQSGPSVVDDQSTDAKASEPAPMNEVGATLQMGTSAKGSSSPANNKTVYMSSATQFLKILTPSSAPQAEQAGGQETDHDGNGATTSHNPKGRKSAFVKEIATVLWGESASKIGRRVLLITVMLAAIGGSGYFLFTQTTGHRLEKLWASKQYEAYAKLANTVLAKNPGNMSLRLKATDAMMLTVLPEFTEQLQDSNYKALNQTLEKLPSLTDNNPTALYTAALLRWVVDMESYFQTSKNDSSIEIFKEESKVQDLLNTWEKGRTDFRLLMDLMAEKFPPFASTHNLIYHHLNTLKEKEDLLGPINQLKDSLKAQISEGQYSLVLATIDDFHRRYPGIIGLDGLKADADSYANLMARIEKKDFTGVYDILDHVSFSSPLFAARVDKLKTESLPPKEVVARFQNAADSWMAGQAEEAVAQVTPLVESRWSEQATLLLKHYNRVIDSYSELAVLDRQSKEYRSKLLEFRKLLHSDTDQYYIQSVEADFSAIKTAELNRAQALLTKADGLWQRYVQSGRINGFLRLESTVSPQFKKRANYLASSHVNSQSANDVYLAINQQLPARWETLVRDISEEVAIQRLRIEDLKDILGKSIATAKLDLLPQP